MRYCLLERFQGAWLGSILGEALAAVGDLSDRSKIINYQPSSGMLSRNKIATAFVERRSIPAELLNLNDEYLPLILLPPILTGHESLAALQTTLAVGRLSDRECREIFKDVLLWGYALALVIKDKLDLNNPIEQILAGVGADSNSLTEQLQMVDTAFKQNRAANEVVSSLLARGNIVRAAIASALYCFITIPQNFYLAVNRARSLCCYSLRLRQIVTTMTATLSGAYNSLSGIPSNWQALGNKNQIYRQEQKIAVDLFNDWLGVCLPQKPKEGNLTVVAPPKIIQPRSSLKIVSQTDY